MAAVEEQYLSLADIKILLEAEKQARPALTSEQQYALQHAALFARVTPDVAAKLAKELMEVPLMSRANAVKIADILAVHADDVRSVFAKERFSLSKEDLDRVVEIVGKYL